jgi:ketosteroid isomerase-like protein
MIDYATAGDLLAAFGQVLVSFDGDAWVGLFTVDAEYHENPFGTPLVGQVALRSYVLTLAETRREVEFTVERHWVSGATVLAAWRVAFTPVGGGDRVRISGFLTAEIAHDGRIARYRQWTQRAPGGAR